MLQFLTPIFANKYTVIVWTRLQVILADGLLLLTPTFVFGLEMVHCMMLDVKDVDPETPSN